MRRICWLCEAALAGALSLPLVLLPLKRAVKVGELLGLLLFRLWGGRRRVALDNLGKTRQAGMLPPDSSDGQIARQSFANVGRSFAEVIQLYAGRGDALLDATRIRGIEHYRAAQAKGRGVILITGHYGNWELMALAFGVQTGPVAVVARRQDNPFLNAFIERVRKRYGNAVFYKQGALRRIMAHLKKQGTVGILMDQAVVRGEGFVIDFLGRGAWTTKMPALLARKTGAPVVPVFISRTTGGQVITIYPELPLSRNANADEALREDTAQCSAAIEGVIRQDPGQWLWLHRRWKRAGAAQL